MPAPNRRTIRLPRMNNPGLVRCGGRFPAGGRSPWGSCVSWLLASAAFGALAACGSLETERLQIEPPTRGTEEPLPSRAMTLEPPADTVDLTTIPGILAATYAVISGPAGEQRDWARFLDLFAPGHGRLTAMYRTPEGKRGFRGITPEQYAELGQAQFDQEGFFEVPIGHTVESFGSIAHVFSSYEARRSPTAEPFMRGINSFQLLWDGERWYVLSILWDTENPDQPIPARYLER